MKVGCSLIVRGDDATQPNLLSMAKHAEAWGFDSLWASDHLIIPPLETSRYPGSATGQFPDSWLQRYFEPLAVLNYLAGCTSRIRLGTSVLILPMRNPIETAKEVAGADVLSQGRILFGVGVGWFKEEFGVLKEPFHERGRRTDEYLQICKVLWTQEPATFQGRYYQFKEARFGPKPVQQPHPPILIAGHSPAAIRRAARLGDGWHPFALTPEGLQAVLPQFQAAVKEAGRHIEEIEISVKVRLRFGESPDPQPPLHGSPEQIIATIKQYEGLGVRHLILDFVPETIDNALATMDRFAREVRPALS
ncbi:MAG: LLM class F420-dependent oxidoreductase [Nitrospinae bacterium]|nr:LLM class F420-dependent oxidoreductase [Nitrospinota bacterium]